MKKNIITFCCCFFSFCLSAQTSYPFFNNMKGERKIIADTVITRVAPSTGAAFDDTLYFGNSVEILMTVPYMEVRNNMVSPWLKVVYQKGKFKKIGFVSAIDIALNNKLIYKNYEFVWGVIANNKKDSFINNELVSKNNYQCKLVAMQDGKGVAMSEFEVDDKVSADSVSITLIDKIKLKEVMSAIEIDISNVKTKSQDVARFNFVLCQKQKLIKMPSTYFSKNCNSTKCNVEAYINYNYKKMFFELKILSGSDFPYCTAQRYSWQNCSYTLIK